MKFLCRPSGTWQEFSTLCNLVNNIYCDKFNLTPLSHNLCINHYCGTVPKQSACYVAHYYIVQLICNSIIPYPDTYLYLFLKYYLVNQTSIKFHTVRCSHLTRSVCLIEIYFRSFRFRQYQNLKRVKVTFIIICEWKNHFIQSLFIYPPCNIVDKFGHNSNPNCILKHIISI